MYGEKCTQHNRSAFAETDKANENYRTKRIFLITDGSGLSINLPARARKAATATFQPSSLDLESDDKTKCWLMLLRSSTSHSYD